MIYIFDLDDTLYREMSFVECGYKVVTTYLVNNYDLNQETTFQSLLKLCYQSRNNVFDRFLKSNDLYSRSLVNKCVSLYRKNKPNISLYPDARTILMQLLRNNIPAYLITDGNKLVQERKVQALNIESFFKKILITSRFGLKHAKPSPYCFLKVAKLEHVLPSQIICVGDNPNKDFIHLKPLGFHTIRLLRGSFKDCLLEKEYEADVTIDSNNNLLDLKL